MATLYTPQQHDLVDATRKITRPWLLLFQQAIGALGITQLIGDVLAGPGSGVQSAALSTTGVTAGTYGDSTHAATFTVDAKGRLTAASEVSILPTFYMSPVTTGGDPTAAELIFAPDGDVVMVPVSF